MATQNTAPERSTLTEELQSFLAPLSEERYQHFFRKGAEKAAETTDVYQQRNKIDKQYRSYAATLARQEAAQSEEEATVTRGGMAALKAMQLGFERALRAEL